MKVLQCSTSRICRRLGISILVILAFRPISSAQACSDSVVCSQNACHEVSDCGISINANGPLTFQTYNGESMWWAVDGVVKMRMKNTGKLELWGDPNAVLGTADISCGGPTCDRVKMGGGDDTSYYHGGRIMLTKNTARLSPGSAGIDAGATDNIGEDGKGAFAWIYTHSKNDVIVGVDDHDFVHFKPERIIDILQETVPSARKKVRRMLPILILGKKYFLPLY